MKISSPVTNGENLPGTTTTAGVIPPDTSEEEFSLVTKPDGCFHSLITRLLEYKFAGAEWSLWLVVILWLNIAISAATFAISLDGKNKHGSDVIVLCGKRSKEISPLLAYTVSVFAMLLYLLGCMFTEYGLRAFLILWILPGFLSASMVLIQTYEEKRDSSEINDDEEPRKTFLHIDCVVWMEVCIGISMTLSAATMMENIFISRRDCIDLFLGTALTVLSIAGLRGLKSNNLAALASYGICLVAYLLFFLVATFVISGWYIFNALVVFIFIAFGCMAFPQLKRKHKNPNDGVVGDFEDGNYGTDNAFESGEEAGEEHNKPNSDSLEIV